MWDRWINGITNLLCAKCLDPKHRKKEARKRGLKIRGNDREKKIGPDAFNLSGKSVRRIGADRTKELIMLRGAWEEPKERNEYEDNKRKRTAADFGTVTRVCRDESESNLLFLFIRLPYYVWRKNAVDQYVSNSRKREKEARIGAVRSMQNWISLHTCFLHILELM